MRRSLTLICTWLLLATTALAQSAPGGGKAKAIAPGTPPANPPGQGILFGEHRITLGMPQDEVLRLVSESYRVERQPNGVWWVYERTGGTIGGLYFTNQLLDQVHRDWEVTEPQSGPAVVTMSTALAAFAQLVPGDPRDCEVAFDHYDTQKSVGITCGKMLVQLYITSNEGGPDRVFVYANLGSHGAGKPVRDNIKSPAAPSGGEPRK